MDRANIIYCIFNEVNNTRIIKRRNKRSIDYSNYRENNSYDAGAKTGSELDGYGNTMTCGTGSILLVGILKRSEYARTVHTGESTNYERVNV